MPIDLKPGLYETLITEGLAQALESLPSSLRAEVAALDPGDAHEYLARHVYERLLAALRAVDGDDQRRTRDQIAGCNLVLEAVGALLAELPSTPDHVREPGALLEAVRSTMVGSAAPPRPVIPLSTSALLTNEGERVSLGTALKREIASADRIDLICAFVNYNGVRILEPEIRGICRRGAMRLLSTTYMGATQRRALDALHEWGVDIRIAYEVPPANTKLHAKAWLLWRESGFHTAFVGSSNLSHSALMDGLEWNVRLSAVDTPHVIRHFASTFERYWADPAFEAYDPARDGMRLDQVLSATTHGDTAPLVSLDIQARPHQVDILESLQAEREEHGRTRNLVVAATGTGKTVVAALDYRRLRRAMGDLTLLFVAHRREILDQSLGTFRAVLRDGSFGELWVGGERPLEHRHVFASVQSLANLDLTALPCDHFDVVIVDEFHHSEAPTYRRLLDHMKPKQLLGLTATPERTDGQNVADFFGGRVAYEMRLWDALDERILCPFQYFGVNDNTDLRHVRWEAGKYDDSEITALYVDRGLARAELVAEHTLRIVSDVGEMRALGYCVNVRHADFMATQFCRMGIPSRCITGQTPSADRADALRALRNGRIKAIFAVDVFNEGVDLPEVNTVLFLRPTESATVFLQQLGRGLRLCEGKPCLTAIDFVGHQNSQFRFDLRYRALTGLSRRGVERQVSEGFTMLPAGCHIELDRVTRDRVLENLRGALSSKTPFLRNELRQLAGQNASYPLGSFLSETGIEPSGLYTNGRYYTGLKRLAGLLPIEAEPDEAALGRSLERMLAVCDIERVGFYRDVLADTVVPELASMSLRQQRLLYMLACSMCPDCELASLDASLRRIWAQSHLRAELIELLDELAARSRVRTMQIPGLAMSPVPVRTHGFYTQAEAVAAFGIATPSSMRQGVHYSAEHRCDALFVTLRKTEKDYSPTTRYHDYLISPTELHWESQSTTSAASPTGKRYATRERADGTVLLFVREAKTVDGRTSPYLCTGPAHYVSHESERPMRIIWRLEHPIPAGLFPTLKAAAG